MAASSEASGQVSGRKQPRRRFAAGPPSPALRIAGEAFSYVDGGGAKKQRRLPSGRLHRQY
jgi:hypothetical protein